MLKSLVRALTIPSIGRKMGGLTEGSFLSGCHPVARSARLLGAPFSTVTRWCRLGQLASIQVGRKRLVPVEAIDEFVGRAKRAEDRSVVHGAAVDYNAV